MILSADRFDAMKGVFSIFFGNLASKLLGAVREIVLAALFGAGHVVAAFRIAQTGYLTPTHALVMETVSSGFIPLYRTAQSEGEEPEQALIIVVLAACLAISLLIALGLFIFRNEIVEFIAPRAPGSILNLAGSMLVICALVIPVYVIGNFLGFLEVANGRFAALAARPSLLNILAIGGAVAASYLKMPMLIVDGVLVGNVIFFVWTLISAVRSGFLRAWFPRDMQLYLSMGKRFALAAAPLIVMPVIAQSNNIVERVTASMIGAHVIPCIDYARFVSNTTQSLLAFPLGISTLTAFGGQRNEASLNHVNKVASQLAVIIFPMATFLACNAHDVVVLLYARGAFGGTAVSTTAAIMTALGAGLGVITIGNFFLVALNAQIRTTVSMANVLIAACVNVAVNLVLWKYLGPIVIGLAAASYGLTLYVLGMIRLGIVRRQMQFLPWILMGCGIYAGFYYLTAGMGSLAIRMLVQVLGACAIWGAVAVLVAPVRNIAVPLLQAFERRLPFRGRNA